MQREEPKKTKITVYEDWPTSIASQAFGANVGCMAFNIDYIVLRNPKMGMELIRIFNKARKLKDKPVLLRDDPIWEKAYNNLKGVLNVKNSN